MNSFSVIPQNKLNALLEEVCRPFDYLSTQINSDASLWDEPIKMCEKIESDPFEFYNILREARKHNSLISGINTPRQYHAILCRVYILLYYRGRNNPRYIEFVFPRLKENMGVYGRTHFESINERIDKILKIEEMLEKLQTEEKKHVKPVFAYVAHNRNEMDHLCIEYNEEELFRGMSGVIRNLAHEFSTNQDEANVWFNAKRVVHTLRDVKRPELLIERAATALVEGQIYNGYEGAQIILLCAYAMIRSSKNNEYFNIFIKNMEDMSSAPTDLQAIQRSIRYVKKWVDEHPITDGYDYIGEPSAVNETYTSADIERIRTRIIENESAERKKLQQKYSLLQQENSELKMGKEKLELKVQELTEQLTEKQSKSRVLTGEEQEVEMLSELESLPILKLLWYLMQLDGANVQGHGKKVPAQNIMSTLSRIPYDTAKKFWKKEDDHVTRQEDLLLKMNHWMKTIGMKFQF